MMRVLPPGLQERKEKLTLLTEKNTEKLWALESSGEVYDAVSVLV